MAAEVVIARSKTRNHDKGKATPRVLCDGIKRICRRQSEQKLTQQVLIKTINATMPVSEPVYDKYKF